MPTLTGPAGRFSIACCDDLQALAHLGHAHQVAGKAIAGRRAADLEIEIGVGQIRLVLAQVARHAAGPGDRPGGDCG